MEYQWDINGISMGYHSALSMDIVVGCDINGISQWGAISMDAGAAYLLGVEDAAEAKCHV